MVGITGSVGKTSVKDICRAILPMRVHASPENFNTEIGLPLAILGAPPETEALVLEMAMRGRGQIAELCRIAEPEIGAITNVGPVHLELLGTLEAIAEAKAEMLVGLGASGRAVVPADAEALEPHLHERLVTITFGAGGDVFASAAPATEVRSRPGSARPTGRSGSRFPFTRGAQPAERPGRDRDRSRAGGAARRDGASGVGDNLLAPARRAGRAAGRDRARERLLQRQPGLDERGAGASRLAPDARPPRRGARRDGGAGPDGPAYHREVGAQARQLGVGPILGVGELAREYAPDAWAPDAQAAVPLAEAMIEPGDAVLVKGSRSVGLELVSDELRAHRGAAGR